MPWYWIVDAEARSIEAFALQERVYERAGRLDGAPCALPPFGDLVPDAAAPWG